MSRITLDRYDDGSPHVVVGWDHPAGGAFWQEWAMKQEVADAEKCLTELDARDTPESTDAEDNEYFALEVFAETGVKRQGGMWPGLPLPLKSHLPADLQHFITDEVERLLLKHAEDPDSGYDRTKSTVDLTKK